MSRKDYERGFEAGWRLGIEFFTGRPAGCTCGGHGRPCFVCANAGGSQVHTDGGPSEADESLRDQIKLAIQTAKAGDGKLLYVIPPGVAGMYADTVMRVLTRRPYPHATVPSPTEETR